jgi:hypothetical protein
VPFSISGKRKNALQPLAETLFAFYNRTIRKVAPNCHIHFDNNYSSVPFVLVGKEVSVRWNDGHVRVVAEGEQVALHASATGAGNYVTSRNHRLIARFTPSRSGRSNMKQR